MNSQILRFCTHFEGVSKEFRGLWPEPWKEGHCWLGCVSGRAQEPSFGHMEMDMWPSGVAWASQQFKGRIWIET